MNPLIKVLVIDDEPSIVKLCKIVLEDMGFEVTSVGDGNRAMEIITEKDFDLILADIKLPKMDGIELFNLMQQEYPELVNKVTFMTGSVMGLETGRFLEKCGRPYLLKPFRANQLKEIVNKSIEMKS